ncbi:MAG TPA: 30S ribosome-binding factor RbfA [Pseudomonadales bacterium]
MAREFGRTQRVADFLRKELSQLIQFELRDPRLGMVSITDVEVSRDLAHAKVFVTVLGCDDKQAAEESLMALTGAAGFLRSQLARIATMRTVPQLHFVFDESVQRGLRLSSLIDRAIEEDEQHHQQLPPTQDD